MITVSQQQLYNYSISLDSNSTTTQSISTATLQPLNQSQQHLYSLSIFTETLQPLNLYSFSISTATSSLKQYNLYSNSRATLQPLKSLQPLNLFNNSTSTQSLQPLNLYRHSISKATLQPCTELLLSYCRDCIASEMEVAVEIEKLLRLSGCRVSVKIEIVEIFCSNTSTTQSLQPLNLFSNSKATLQPLNLSAPMQCLSYRAIQR